MSENVVLGERLTYADPKARSVYVYILIYNQYQNPIHLGQTQHVIHHPTCLRLFQYVLAGLAVTCHEPPEWGFKKKKQVLEGCCLVRKSPLGAIPVVIRFHLCSSMFINDYLTFLNRDAKWRYIICIGADASASLANHKGSSRILTRSWEKTQQPPKKS